MTTDRWDAEDIATGTTLSGPDKLAERIEDALAEAYNAGHDAGSVEGLDEGAENALGDLASALSRELDTEVGINSTDDAESSIDRIVEALQTTIADRITDKQIEETEDNSAPTTDNETGNDNMTTDNTTDNAPALALVPVTNIADARKAKAAKDEETDLEVSGPQAVKLQGDEWLINACDGEQVYVWVARKKTKRSKGYTITEVYPGLTKRRTELRNVKEPKDLELKHATPLTTLSDVLEDLEEIMFEDFEDDGEAAN